MSSDKLIMRYSHSGMGRFIDTVRTGWNNYSFIFYIGGISAILGSLFGWAGWLSTIVTVGFFYLTGRMKKRIEEIDEKQRKRVRRPRP